MYALEVDAQGEPRNPYVADPATARFEPVGWAALLVLRAAHLWEHLAWYQFAPIVASGISVANIIGRAWRPGTHHQERPRLGAGDLRSGAAVAPAVDGAVRVRAGSGQHPLLAAAPVLGLVVPLLAGFTAGRARSDGIPTADAPVRATAHDVRQLCEALLRVTVVHDVGVRCGTRRSMLSRAGTRG